MNYRDIAFKALWTGIAAVLGFVTVALTDAPTWWAPFAVMAANSALAWVRQKTGETPPDLAKGSR